MPHLASRAPRPAIAEHPEFALMLVAALERFHCTLGEVREDYWLGRAWRALAGDPELEGRVARVGFGGVLLAGPGYGPAPRDGDERSRLERHVADRIAADTGRLPDSLDMAMRFSDERFQVADGCVLSLLAQSVVLDERWHDLAPYATDLSPVIVPVAYSLAAVVAA